MKADPRLLFGPLAALLLLAGIAGLPAMVPGYDGFRQTVSEIGQVGSPAQLPFAALLCAVAGCVLTLSWALARGAAEDRRPALPAYLVASMALSIAGVGLFPFPHPLHNYFGLSELIGYQAPLALALAWRGGSNLGTAIAFSWTMAALVWAMIALNLISLDRASAAWAWIQPHYGIVQRTLFLAWFTWCAGIGLILFRRRRSADRAGSHGVHFDPARSSS